MIFFKTGNVLSESSLFNVNNIEISGNLNSNNQFFSDAAIKEGFKELISKVLMNKDLSKLKNLNSNRIKDLVSYYQISDSTEDRITNKVTKRYNIFLIRKKFMIYFIILKFLTLIFRNTKYIFYRFTKKMMNYSFITKTIFIKTGTK